MTYVMTKDKTAYGVLLIFGGLISLAVLGKPTDDEALLAESGAQKHELQVATRTPPE